MRQWNDVVVVGAGYAGLAAALRLHDVGSDVVVVEAADRVGGRTCSEVRPDGLRVDHGGQWVGPTQEHLLALTDRFGCETFPTWETGDHIEVWRDGTRVRYAGTLPESSPGVREYNRVTALLDDLARTVDTEQPWRTPRFAEWDAQTALTFFCANTDDEDALRRLALTIQGVWCAEPDEISFFHVLFYIAAASGYRQLMDTADCAQDSRFVTGADGPARAIAAHRVIVTLPPTAVRAIDFHPRLPVSRTGWLSHSPMGRVAKAHVFYAKPFWREAGLSGVASLYDDGPVGVVFDNSPPDASAGVLVAFVYGNRLSAWSALGPGERRAAVLAAVTKVWSWDSFVHGGYEAYSAPGGWTGYGRYGWRMPTGAVHWAGSETASVWNGYIDGAISSGYRAAEEVLRDL